MAPPKGHIPWNKGKKGLISNKRLDITNHRFGRLVAVELKEIKNKRTYWLCQCDCGNEAVILLDSLRAGRTKSCGCLNSETSSINLKKALKVITKHGLSYTKAYINESASRYRARKLKQSPPNTNLSTIQEYYTICSHLNYDKVDFHVDHYQPLNKGGLHHEDNLQILPDYLNLEKSDKWPLTKDEEIKYEGFRI